MITAAKTAIGAATGASDVSDLVFDLARRTTSPAPGSTTIVPELSEQAIGCRLNRHAWKRYRVTEGATYKGVTKRSWFTEERYCLWGCGTIRIDPVDSAGRKYPSRYKYEERFQVKGGVSPETLAALRKQDLLRALATGQADEPLTREAAAKLIAS